MLHQNLKNRLFYLIIHIWAENKQKINNRFVILKFVKLQYNEMTYSLTLFTSKN